MPRLNVLPALLLLWIYPQLVWAARPFITDDARLTTAGSCQLETWGKRYPDSHEFWFVPACNPGGNFEFTVGTGRNRNSHESSSQDTLLQGKTLLRPLQTNDWGLGFSAGVVRHPGHLSGPNGLGNHFAYLPLTLSRFDDRLLVHANLGWIKDKASRQHKTNWGLGAEWALDHRFSVVAEGFGDDRSPRPYWQTGLRYSVIPGLLQIDLSGGRQHHGGAGSQWLSIGVRYTPDQLF